MFNKLLLLGVGFVAVLAGGVTVVAANQESRDKTLVLVGVEGSGIGGEARLTEAGADVQVVVSATGLTLGESYFSGAYDASSVTCQGGLIGSFAPVAVAADDTATISYTVPGPLGDIFSVSIRLGESPPGTVVACGEDSPVPELAEASPVPELFDGTPVPELILSPPPTGSGGLIEAEGSGPDFLLLAVGSVILAATGLAVRQGIRR